MERESLQGYWLSYLPLPFVGKWFVINSTWCFPNGAVMERLWM